MRTGTQAILSAEYITRKKYIPRFISYNPLYPWWDTIHFVYPDNIVITCAAIYIKCTIILMLHEVLTYHVNLCAAPVFRMVDPTRLAPIHTTCFTARIIWMDVRITLMVIRVTWTTVHIIKTAVHVRCTAIFRHYELPVNVRELRSPRLTWASVLIIWFVLYKLRYLYCAPVFRCCSQYLNYRWHHMKQCRYHISNRWFI